MNLLALARDQARRAADRVRDARTAFGERRLADASRYAQEAVELALKAALRSLGVEVPKRHDVAPVLGDLADVLPSWLAKEVPGVKRLSADLADRRSLAMYGDERTGRPASELFDRPDEVNGHLEGAEHVVAVVRRLLSESEKGDRRSRGPKRGSRRRL